MSSTFDPTIQPPAPSTTFPHAVTMPGGLTVPALYEENTRLRWALREARDELAKWGWGDFHYGHQPQEKSVVDTMAKIDLALRGGGESTTTEGDGRW